MKSRVPLGYPALPMPGPDGSLAYPPSLEACVRQSLQIILTTRPGELLQHPDFGAGLDRLLHRPNSLSLRRDIHDQIAESLASWEPRIEVDRIDVSEVEGAPTQLRIEIAYRLRGTGAQSTLGLTLGAGG